MTRAVVAGDGHGLGDAGRAPQEAKENVPRAVKTHAQVSGDTEPEPETSPYRATLADAIWGDGPRNSVLAAAIARSRLRPPAGGTTGAVVVGAGDDAALGDTMGEGEMVIGREKVEPGVGERARGRPATSVPAM